MYKIEKRSEHKMNYGKQLTEIEVARLYINHPKIMIENPCVVIKNIKNGKVMFMVVDKKKYIIEQQKDDTKWFEVK